MHFMVFIVLCIIFFIAGACKAAADLMRNKRDISIFQNLKSPKRWMQYVENKAEVFGSSRFAHSFYEPMLPNRYKPHVFRCPIDAWHVVNGIQVALWCIAISIARMMPVFVHEALQPFIIFAGSISAFWLSFNLCYNKLFVIKKYRK